MDAQQRTRFDRTPRHNRSHLSQTSRLDTGPARGREHDHSLTYSGSLPRDQHGILPPETGNVRTKLDRVDSLHGLAWSDCCDLGSKNNSAKKDIVVQCNQSKRPLGVVDGSEAVELERVSRPKFNHTTWRNNGSRIAQWHAR
jgi:hypothetical protein